MEVHISGEVIALPNKYNAYDTIEIRLAGDAYQVLHNGLSVRTGGSLAFPMRAVAMISDPEAVIYNIRWTGPGVHAFAMADRAPIEFNSSGMKAVSLLEKQRMQGIGDVVQSRAMSVDKITSDTE